MPLGHDAELGTLALDQLEASLISEMLDKGPVNADIISVVFGINRQSAREHLERLLRCSYIRVCDGVADWYQLAYQGEEFLKNRELFLEKLPLLEPRSD